MPKGRGFRAGEIMMGSHARIPKAGRLDRSRAGGSRAGADAV